MLAPQKRPAARLTRPVREFLETEVSGGIVLMIAVVVALAWANSPFQESYHSLWETELKIELGRYEVHHDLRHWVNDALMALFFFVVGMEIKRELVVGDLSTLKKATLPGIAALGGMVVPAAFYILLTSGQAQRGWGVPMATDIALALGVLALLSRTIPSSLRVLLLSLAIVDDIGAVLVIAIFYSSGISWTALGSAALLVWVVILMRALRVWWVPAYIIVGTGVWFATLQSGIHATIAGVVLGLLAPAKPLAPEDVEEESPVPQEDTLGGTMSVADADANKLRAVATIPVTDRLIHLLHPWTSFIVLPIFALANAGVSLGREDLSGAVGSTVAWGIVAGLVLGKIVGISAASWIALRLGAEAPGDIAWRHILGMSALAGIGFTMSLFITELAFDEADLLQEAKVGILAASALAALIGAVLLKLARAVEQPEHAS